VPEVQVVHRLPALEDEPRPGDRAADHIRPQQRAKRPPLQVRPPECLVEQDAMSGTAKTITELDVLDGGTP
jgi:hypothetical protein